MAELCKNYASFVAVGSQNPQILNIDFISSNKIVSIDNEPYKSLIKGEKPFSKFISTPPFSNLVIGPLEFVVEEQRFQVRETGISDWNGTIVFDVATRYFEVLQYTPIRLAGINFNGTISFGDLDEAIRFQELFFPKSCELSEILSDEKVSANSVLRFPAPGHDGKIMFTLDSLNEKDLSRNFAFNYEFDCFHDNQTDWEKFKSELSSLDDLSCYVDTLLGKILKAI